MNELILKLAKESGISFGGHPMNPLNVYPGELKKFAELILRESMDNLEWHGHDEAVSQLKWFKTNKLGLN